jgi:hypothetical protein
MLDVSKSMISEKTIFKKNLKLKWVKNFLDQVHFKWVGNCKQIILYFRPKGSTQMQRKQSQCTQRISQGRET